MPATVQAILASRIDRLSLEDKHLLQIAAVIGRRVPFSLLRAVADLPDDALRGGLDRLQAAQFVYETGLFPDLDYSFKHAITQEVAYGGILQDSRRELHAQIVSSIETLHHNRLDEQIELLAHHALRGDLREGREESGRGRDEDLVPGPRRYSGGGQGIGKHPARVRPAQPQRCGRRPVLCWPAADEDSGPLGGQTGADWKAGPGQGPCRRFKGQPVSGIRAVKVRCGDAKGGPVEGPALEQRRPRAVGRVPHVRIRVVVLG